MRFTRTVRFAAVLAVLVAVSAVVASAGGARSLTYNCSDIYYTTATNYGSNESIVVDVFNEGHTIPSGVTIGSLGWAGPYNTTYYTDHSSTTWKYSNEDRGTYDIYVTLGGYLCRNPHGQFKIQ